MVTYHELDPARIEELISKHDAVIVDIWAEWCHPCKLLGTELRKIGKKLGNKLAIIKINADEASESTDLDSVHFYSKYKKIRAIPVLFFFKDGKLVDQNLYGFIDGCNPDEDDLGIGNGGLLGCFDADVIMNVLKRCGMA